MKNLLLLIPMFAGLIYHLGQKKIRPDLPPYFVFTIIYFLSMAIMFVSGRVTNTNFLFEIKSLSLKDFFYLLLVSIGVIGIELGFLLVYRADFSISYAALIVNIGLGILLLMAGLFLFKENLNLIQLMGVIICLIGIYLIKAFN